MRALLVAPPHAYRVAAYQSAAAALDIELAVASFGAMTFPGAGHQVLCINEQPVGEGAAQIVEWAAHHPVDGIIASDDSTVQHAALAARMLGLRHASLTSVRAFTDKLLFRQLAASAGVLTPPFIRLPLDAPPPPVASLSRSGLSWPLVLKPLRSGGSRGVIRVDSERSLQSAMNRLRTMLDGDLPMVREHPDRAVLAEAFIPGAEFSLDAMVTPDAVVPLAFMDKLVPMNGPHFAERFLVQPAGLSAEIEREAIAATEAVVQAAGYRHGPVHAEFRVNDHGVWLLEVAPRAVGGQCGQALRFEPHLALEELELRAALGLAVHNFTLASGASGALMLHPERAGVLRAVRGEDAVRRMPLVEHVNVCVRPGERVAPLPDEARYMGFVIARGPTREDVAATLRNAESTLTFEIGEV